MEYRFFYMFRDPVPSEWFTHHFDCKKDAFRAFDDLITKSVVYASLEDDGGLLKTFKRGSI